MKLLALMHFRNPSPPSSPTLGLGLGLRLEMRLNVSRNLNPNPRGVRKCISAKLFNLKGNVKR